MAKINKIWIVEKPTKHSEMADVVWSTDLKGLRLQFLGGLKAGNIIGAYTTKSEAMSVAKKIFKPKKRR